EEAVTGLSRGSTVEFNGIRVGDVIDLRIDDKNPRNVYARVRVESTAPVRTDTKATLMPVGITGTSLIRLTSGEDPNSQPLVSTDVTIPTIMATPSPMSKLLAGGEDVLYNFNELLIGARNLFSQENVASLSRTLAQLEQTTAALADKESGVNLAIANFSKASNEANRAFGEMNKLMQSSDKLANGELKQSLERANAAMASFESSMGTLEKLVQDNRGAIDSGARGVAQLGPTMTELRGTLSSVQGVVRQIDNDPAGYLLNREPMKEFKP
ncbi:MAG: MCE family protein, partial [Ramlibacter sp.]|nr:MCE family protein [Ramlibacter sp.]